MKKYFIINSLILVLGLFMASCVPASTSVSTLTFTDGLDREITLDSPAQKIVSLSPPITEMLFALGAGEQVIGRDAFSDYPEAAGALPDIGGGMGKYDLEAIVSLEPDLVIAGAINTPELVQSLEDLGLSVYFLSNPADIEGTFSALQTLGVLSGRSAEAGKLVSELSERTEAIKTLILDATASKPTVYYELDASDPAKPYTPGPGTFYTALIENAGGENIGATLSGEWAQIGLEALLTIDPEVILLGDAMWGVTPESVSQRPGWSALTAVKEGRVLPFDDNLIARIGPRQVDGLEALARILHPEVFK